MIGKLILTVLVAMTINMSVDRPAEDLYSDTWEDNSLYSDTDYSDEVYGEDYGEDVYYTETMDLMFDLAIYGADWVGMSASDEEIMDALTEITLNEDLEIVYAYYGSAEGDFYMYPNEALPEGYDFRERPVYQSTVEEEIYYTDPYVDAMTGRQIQTIGITVYDDNGFIGVLGIDVYVD